MSICAPLGAKIRKLRNRRCWSQEELGMRIGVDQVYLSRIEAGRINVTLETVEQLAAALDIDFIDFFNPPEDSGRSAPHKTQPSLRGAQ